MKCHLRRHHLGFMNLHFVFEILKIDLFILNLILGLRQFFSMFSVPSFLLLFVMFSSGCWSIDFQQHNGNQIEQLSNMTIEELMNLEFTVGSKRPEKLYESTAAAFAVSSEDIKRSGVTNIPDALRMVPGIQVAQHDANSWAITARGFSGLSRGISGQFANKLLVLNDGRSVYTPLFSGVSWETQDVLLDDLERIEIIRGPGATLWGANAVNGVINIISKKAQDTQGGLLSVGGGTELQGFGHFRYGGRLNDNSFFRIYGKYQKVDNLVDSTGTETADGWHVLRGGFRADWDNSTNHSLTLQGDIYSGKIGQRYNIINSLEPPFQQQFDFDANISGGNVLGRWKYSHSNASEMTLQVYFDRVKREEAAVRGSINTYDLDLQHWFSWSARQEIIWGAGYRFISDSFDSSFAFHLVPGSRKVHIFNAFVQDEISLMKNRIRLTLGSKFEYNEFTGFEIQPSIRILCTPSDKNTIWGAVSRAVRTPSRGEEDVRIIVDAVRPDSPTAFLILSGNRDLKSENLLALELGYRQRPVDRLSFDMAAFYNNYDHLRTDEPDFEKSVLSPYPPHFMIPIVVGNKLDGRTFGLEFSIDWQTLKSWRLSASYTYLQMHLDPVESQDNFTEHMEGQSPHHQLFLHSFVDLPWHIALNFSMRFVDKLASQGVDNYLTADCSLGWQINKNLRWSVVAQNLLESHHAENSQILNIGAPQIVTGTESSEVQRSIFSKFTWQF